MAHELNIFAVAGRLVRDSELSFTQNGTPVLNFSIANNRRRSNNQEHTNFFNCVVWGNYGKTMSEHLKKGSKINIEGEIQKEKYDYDGNKGIKTVINVKSIYFA